MSPRLPAALAYADHGWNVFPLGPNKAPLRLCPRCRDGRCPGQDSCQCDTDTCHGFYAATTDADRIRRWYGEHPDWQLAIRTGAPSGLVALDIDIHAGGDKSIRALQRRTGKLPQTVMQLSGSGSSVHMLFAHPGHKVSISAGKLGDGLDVRGDGGYIVAAPTLHPKTGRPYTWQGHPFGPLASWPEALDALVQPARGTTQLARATPLPNVDPGRRVRALLEFVLDSPPNTRNTRLHWAACRLGEMVAMGEVEQGSAVDALYTAGRHIDLPHAELVGTGNGGTIFSGLSAGRRAVVA
jgi:hypothetical protein